MVKRAESENVKFHKFPRTVERGVDELPAAARVRRKKTFRLEVVVVVRSSSVADQGQVLGWSAERRRER